MPPVPERAERVGRPPDQERLIMTMLHFTSRRFVSRNSYSLPELNPRIPRVSRRVHVAFRRHEFRASSPVDPSRDHRS
jgi:hypothetical protein